ncbi:putative TTHA0068-like superfamily protein [Helianthus debilis subsp. tardiflorus]
MLSSSPPPPPPSSPTPPYVAATTVFTTTIFTIVTSNNSKFTEVVAISNSRDYHGCHDYLEEIWNDSEDPIRYIVHGILQCSLKHKGAMMEIGEGLWKLRKLNFDTGPFHQFERDMSAVLDFIYQTQL